MTKKAKIVAIITGIIALFILLTIYFVSRDLGSESKLKGEIKNYHNDLVQNKKVEASIIVTTGDYGKIEKALKNYLKDCNKHYNDLNNILKEEQIKNNLSIENIKTDGPNFIKTKEYLSDIKNRLNESSKIYLNDFKKQNIMNYLSQVSNYYKEFYYNLATNEDIMISEKHDFDSKIENFHKILDKQEEMLNFLAANGDSWRVINDSLVFYNNELATSYNNYLEELKALNV